MAFSNGQNSVEVELWPQVYKMMVYWVISKECAF